MSILPGFAIKEGVVAIGEIGYDVQTARYVRQQLDLAKELEAAFSIYPNPLSRSRIGRTADRLSLSLSRQPASAMSRTGRYAPPRLRNQSAARTSSDPTTAAITSLSETVT